MHENPEIAALLARLSSPSLPGVDLSLTRMEALLAALGNPERHLPPVIHLAGTNGKGSTLAFLRAIYQAAGYTVHAYSSPHLVRFNERIELANAPISDARLREVLARVEVAAQQVPTTFFEATTAAAFLAFAEHPASVVLLETGLGGRLDATNLVPHPLASVITPIHYDHMEFLGHSLAAIAGEKAGIMKSGAPCFVGAQLPEALAALTQRAQALGVALTVHGADWRYQPLAAGGLEVECGAELFALPEPSLPGLHQHHNASLASVVAWKNAGALPVTPAHIAEGVRAAHWPARLQRLTRGALVEQWADRGEVFLDGGHNPHAAAMLAEWLTARQTPVTLILGMMARKEIAATLRPLARYVAHLIAVPIAGEASHAPEAIAEAGRACGIAAVDMANSLADAGGFLKNDGKGTLLIAGSLFLAGEVLKNHG